MNKLLLYYHTIRHLKPRQLFYQFWYRLKWNYFNLNYNDNSEITFRYDLKNWHLAVLTDKLNYQGNLSFSFLNKDKSFDQIIDSNFLEYGKLWNYHLQYLDYLLDEKIPPTERERILVQLSKSIIDKKLKLEPYPISLRLVNALIFIQKHNIRNEEINKAVGMQLSFLENNPEFHLLANHLLENYIALCFVFSILYSKDKQEKYFKLLMRELKEQIVPDGAHYERTPSYHAQIFIHLLQLVHLLVITNQRMEVCKELKSICSKMLGWYKAMSQNGNAIPLFNDSIESNSPAFSELQELAKHCSIIPENYKLNESGYRILQNDKVRVIVNCGNICPGYQAGHAHADILHFVFYLNGKAILVDTGISSYENTTQRFLEKSTRMHNTVSFGETDQSQIWSSFRIAKRAKVEILKDKSGLLQAEVKWHNGILHKRSFTLNDDYLIIEDSISNLPNKKDLPKANFHFDYLLNEKIKMSNNLVLLDELQIQFINHQELIQENYLQATDFNKQNEALKISAYFADSLKTVISWKR